ncbi:HNH endonuclease [Microbacterium sp. CFH 31415]|uniref:HNH endonuclease signature motif containing protein n=1 Tax=Microbacterium sp. CFH 31415 TaxID=2921732 RepID=UPI001F12F38D|nr:HNH endonuclease signature motif containing protein [Microbacterium sp. CFH 31415]MCH6229205.1 HNH endonuclease [Microbacterium sp. CFH 31415]
MADDDPFPSPEERDVWDEPWDGFEAPDDVGRVTEVADMMSVFAAQRVMRVDQLRRNALADAAFYGGAVAGVVERSVRLELAAALRITEHAAAGLLGFAQALVHRYPAALDALGRASITERHAEILVDLMDAVEPDVRGRVTTTAVELAVRLPVGAFRRQLRALLEHERAASLAERHDWAVRHRRVIVEPADDGMAWLHAFLPAVEARAIQGRLTAIAKTLADDDQRTLDERRADVLGDLLIDGDTTALPPQASGIRATVSLTVPALTLVDEASGAAPAVVEGVGPVTAAQARQLAGGARGWTRILTHPETGIVLSVGRDQYRPPPALRRLVRWRADRCMAPGCSIPADRCEIDHTVAWEHGGATALDNLAPLCKGHHTLKHHGGWRVNQIPGHWRGTAVDLAFRAALPRRARATRPRLPPLSRRHRSRALLSSAERAHDEA